VTCDSWMGRDLEELA